MATVKTTVVFPEDTWRKFQKIVGTKKTSKVLSSIAGKIVRKYHAKKLLNHKSDSTWDDAYLEVTNKVNIEDIKNSSI
jgi:hypothetical protein